MTRNSVKEQSKQWMSTHSPKKLNKFKQMSSAGQGAVFPGAGKEWWWWNSCNKETTIMSEVYCKH
jgi:hypothetical protein